MNNKTIKLEMKKRGMPRVYIPYEQAVMVVQSDNKELALNVFKEITSNPNMTHDKDFMELIVNFVPSTGVSVMESARWVKIAIELDEMDENEEGQILELTDKEVEMVYNRLRSPDFKLNRVTTSFYKFLNDLEKATGKKIFEEEQEEEDD